MDRNRRSFVLGAMALTLALPARARAAGVVAELTASTTTLRVGEEVELSLEVRREGSGAVPDPELPSGLADGFEVVSQYSSGSGFEIRIGGGRNSRTMHSSMSITAIALKPGTYKLSFDVDDAGDAVRSNIVEIVVEGTPEASLDAARPSTGKPDRARGDVFVWAATDKTQAWIGEQIEYRLDVYERSLLSSVALRTPPNFADFYSYDLPEGDGAVEEVAGVPYRVRPGMRRALFPQKAGTLVIGAPEITIGRRRRDRGAAVSIEVKPLPAAGQPAKFSPNNVGRFTVTAKVDRTKVQAGQPFTWTVEIAGEGNVALVDPGEWPQLQGARRYDPKVDSQMQAVDRVRGRRTYAFLVIPEQGGKLELPPVRLDYFDPLEGRYDVASSEALVVEVEGNAAPSVPEPDAPVVTGEPTTESFAPIIVADALPRETSPTRVLTTARWAWATAAVPSVAIAVWGGTAAWRRWGPDEDARRRSASRRLQRERIDTATAALDSGAGFHAAIAAIAHDLAVSHAGAEATGLPRPELVRLLSRRGVAAADLRTLEHLLERCDAARFAAQLGTVDDRRALLDDAIALTERSSLARGPA